MFRILILVISILICSISSAQKKEAISYSDAYQVDSSDYFLIPRLLDEANKKPFEKGKGYMLWGYYTDMLFYNSRTNQTKKLFDGKPVLIAPFLQKRSSYYSEEKEPDVSGHILPRLILYSVRSEDFNGDGVIDSDDPSYMYVSTKTGEQLRQITPAGFDVISWTVSKDKKIILVKGLTDKNKNRNLVTVMTNCITGSI